MDDISPRHLWNYMAQKLIKTTLPPGRAAPVPVIVRDYSSARS